MNALLIDGIVAIMEKKMDLLQQRLILILAQRSRSTDTPLHSSVTKTKQLGLQSISNYFRCYYGNFVLPTTVCTHHPSTVSRSDSVSEVQVVQFASPRSCSFILDSPALHQKQKQTLSSQTPPNPKPGGGGRYSRHSTTSISSNHNIFVVN